MLKGINWITNPGLEKMTDCSLCGVKEAKVCPECMYKELMKEAEKWNDIISKIQIEHIIPKWPEKYQDDPPR